MSALDEMRKRVKQNKSILDNAETKTSNTLNEMRQRVEAKKQEIEAQNKKVQEYNDFLKTTDTSKIKPLQLPQDKLLSRERVAELAKNQTDAQREIDYYTKNPATFGSNLKRNLLQPTKQTLKNFSTAALSTGANTIEYFQDNNIEAIRKANLKAISEAKKAGDSSPLKSEAYKKTIEAEAQKRYEDTDTITQRLRNMRAKTIQETQNMEEGLGKSIAESSIVVGDMLPAIGAGVLTGGVGASLAIYGNAAQNAYQTAIENGATHEQASNNAILNGLLETIIELIGGKALGKLTKLPTLSSKVGSKILAKMPNGIKTALNNTFIRGGLGIASDVLEEGFEEVASGFIQPFIDRVTYNSDAPLASLESQWEAFNSSILPTLMFAGINTGSNRVISSLEKQMAVKSVNAQIDNLANKQIEQIENTDLPMLERVEMINEVKKQQLETKTKFAEEINKFEVVETNPETNLKTTPQNNTNFAKTTPINENISQKNIQNVSNLQNTYENQKMVEKHIVDNIEATTLVAGKKSTTRQKKKQIVEEFLNREYPNNKIDFQINYDTGNVRVTNIYNKQELEEYGETLQKQRQNQIEEYNRKHPDTIQQDEIDLRYNELPDDKQLRDMFEINDKIDELVENLNKKGYEIGVEHSKASADASYINVETSTGTKQIRIANHYKSGVSGNADVNINMSEYGSKKVLLEDIEKAITNVQKTVQNNSTIQGLEDYTEQDIKDLVSDYIEDITNEKISNIALINEDGNIKAKVYYNGNLNEIEPLEIEGKQIKIEQQKYEESDVFEDRAGYNVDIIEENEYNTEKREVARKPETRNYTYKKIESRDIARVNSDYMTNEVKYADDVGVVNFDDVSYAYEKTNDAINVLLKFKGSQNYIKGVTEYVRGSSNTRPKGYNRYVEIARSRYADNNISDADGRRTRTSEESNIETDRTRRQGRKDDIAENVKNNGNNLENSEEQGSFSMPETDNKGKKLTKEQQMFHKENQLKDENGNIIRLYHGTRNDITIFNPSTGGEFGPGIYLTDRAETAEWYGRYVTKGESDPKVMEVYAIMKKPYIIDKFDYIDATENVTPKTFMKRLIKKGYDGIIGIESNGYDKQYVVFNPNQIKSVDNLNPTEDPDILKEPRAEYENQMKLNMDVTTEATESAKNYNGGLKPIVIGHRIWEGYKKQGYIDLNNTKVSTARDMAEIAQIFRNPYYETARIIYLKGDTIVGQEAVSSRLPNSSKITKEDTLSKAFFKMSDRMKRLEADGYYLVHNHPSGTAKASQEDIKLTRKVSSNVSGFKGHIIVDHGTYAYIYKNYIENDIDWYDELKVDDKNAFYKDSEFQTSLPSNKIPWSNIKITSRDDFASLMYNLKNSKNYSTLILRDSDAKVNAIIDVPNNFFNVKIEQIEGYIKNIAKKYGASDAFIGTQNARTFEKIQQITNLKDAILYNKVAMIGGRNVGSGVFNVKDTEKAVRVSEETKEERIERVRKYVEETQKSIGTLGANVSRKDIVARIIDNYGITAKGNSKELDRVSKEIQELIKKGSFTDNKIKGYAEQLIENLKVTIDDYYNANKELKELIRRTKLYASDSVKAGFTDWADFRKTNVGTIRATNDADALPVDTFYQELSEMYGETFFPSDIINPSDQLKKIADVAKQIKVIDMTLKQNIEENFGEQAREEIVNGLIENFKTLREQMTGEIKDIVETPEIKTRRWSQTVRKNDMVQTFLDKDLQDYKYVVRSNKATIAKANETLMRKGYDESIHYFDSVVESGKFPTVDDIALGERLIQESIKRGEFEKATEIIADVSILGTELGQAVQAMSMISRLSPAGQLMYLERAVKRINEKQQTKRKKPSKKKKTGLDKVMDEGKVGDVDIKITDEMKKEILSAKTPEELEIAVTRVKEQIAAQLPVEASEKLSEWRYLAMLGNPKTHIRNTVGNLVMTAPYEMKNLYQRIIETTFDSKLDERTKTFKKATDVVKAFAEDMVEQNKDTLTGNGYTNIQSELKNMRKIYKSKVLETLKQANLKALDFEDFVFKKRTFKSALAEYLTANGIKTEKDIQENQELIQKGINYAIEEAKKATFNQYNSVATAISRFESDKTIGKILIGGLAPFKRTPLNIVKTAWQYSPAGLAETLTFRTMDLKNGLITADDYIERISQGLTGVSITAIGFLLASMGVLTGSMGSKKKDKYEQSIGLRVPYSIKAGDRYIDISWLSPSAIPLLIGAELYSLADDGESGLSIDGIVKVVEKMMNPISEMTMLSTFNDALINYAGDDNELSGLAGIADTIIKSYISQAFPTLGGQINRIIDPTIRTTKVSKNSKFKTGEQIARQNMNKIIGLSYLLEPSTDVWGNIQKRSDNVVLRSLDALVNPASIVKDKSTNVDKEIMKLYEENENDKIIPKTPNNYFTLNGYKYEFSAKEYTAFKITYGQTAYTELQKLFRTTEYKAMTAEDKEKAIEDVYDLAEQVAREEYGITPNALIKEYGEKEAANRLFDNKQLPKYEMAKKNIGLSLKQYYEAYNAQKGVTGKKDAKGKIISGTEKNNRINAMEKTGLTRTQATQMYKILEGTL